MTIKVCTCCGLENDSHVRECINCYTDYFDEVENLKIINVTSNCYCDIDDCWYQESKQFRLGVDFRGNLYIKETNSCMWFHFKSFQSLEKFFDTSYKNLKIEGLIGCEDSWERHIPTEQQRLDAIAEELYWTA